MRTSDNRLSKAAGASPGPDRNALTENPFILVVEDDPTLRLVWQKVLLRAGFEVAVAEDGLDAFEAIRRRIPDLLVLDLGLPRMRGEVLLRELRRAPAHRAIPVIVVTGQPDAPELPVEATLHKPFSTQALLEAVKSCLDERPRR